MHFFNVYRSSRTARCLPSLIVLEPSWTSSFQVTFLLTVSLTCVGVFFYKTSAATVSWCSTRVVLSVRAPTAIVLLLFYIFLFSANPFFLKFILSKSWRRIRYGAQFAGHGGWHICEHGGGIGAVSGVNWWWRQDKRCTTIVYRGVILLFCFLSSFCSVSRHQVMKFIVWCCRFTFPKLQLLVFFNREGEKKKGEKRRGEKTS